MCQLYNSSNTNQNKSRILKLKNVTQCHLIACALWWYLYHILGTNTEHTVNFFFLLKPSVPLTFKTQLPLGSPRPLSLLPLSLALLLKCQYFLRLYSWTFLLTMNLLMEPVASRNEHIYHLTYFSALHQCMDNFFSTFLLLINDTDNYPVVKNSLNSIRNL